MIKITKRPTFHIYDIIFDDVSWELSNKLRKFLGNDFVVEYCHADGKCAGLTVTGPEILPRILDNIKDRIPEWALEIKIKAEREEIDDLLAIRKWLKNTPIPQEPMKTVLKDLHKVILELREDLENEANKGKVLPCGLGDLTDILNLFKLLEADKKKEALEFIWKMETGAREYIPYSVSKMLMKARLFHKEA